MAVGSTYVTTVTIATTIAS